MINTRICLVDKICQIIMNASLLKIMLRSEKMEKNQSIYNFLLTTHFIHVNESKSQLNSGYFDEGRCDFFHSNTGITYVLKIFKIFFDFLRTLN